MSSPAPTASSGNRLDLVDALRGIAALAVVWFHCNTDHPPVSPAHWATLLQRTSSVGWTGVEVFFVISGFILPYSMQRQRYRWRHGGAFLLKRFVRLYPPFFVSLILAVVLQVVGAHWGSRGASSVPLRSFAGHLIFNPTAFGYDWLNPVYWTLRIEFEFYLYIALIFPLLNHPSPWLRRATLAASLLATPLPAAGLDLFLPCFVCGMAAFLRATRQVSVGEFLLILAAAIAVGWHTSEPLVIGVSVPAAILLALPLTCSWRPALGLGAISYSLYLIHAPVATRVLNLSARYTTTASAKVLCLALALVASLIAAVVFYFLVEKPSLELAGKIRVGPPRAAR